MSDGSLSQDEIDALLTGSGGMDVGAPPPSADGFSQDALRQFSGAIAATTDSQGSNLAALTGKSVTISAPQAEIMQTGSLSSKVGDSSVQVMLNFSDGAPGEHGYLMSSDLAVAIAGAMMGQTGVDLNDASLNALGEAVSNLAGPMTTALGDAGGVTIMNDVPSPNAGTPDLPDGDFVVLAYPVAIEGSGPQTLYEYFELGIAQAVSGQPASSDPFAAAGVGDPFAGLAGMTGGGGAPMAGGFGGGGTPMGGGQQTSVQSVQFPAFGQGSGGPQEQGNIGLLMDVYMEMTVELGRTRKLIKDILGMGEGTIIELDKLAGEPVDILVNHKLIAKGEVVVIDENFGVRVTEIVSTMERMSSMY